MSADSLPAAGGAERRNFARRRAKGTATIRPANKPMARPVRITLVDITPAGVCIVTTPPLEVGAVVVLEMQPPGVSKAMTFQATVNWVTAGSTPQEIRAGCTFERRLSYPELQRFV